MNELRHKIRSVPSGAGRVLAGLIRLLRIDVVHSCSPAADRLVLAARGNSPVPWVNHARASLTAADLDVRNLLTFPLETDPDESASAGSAGARRKRA